MLATKIIKKVLAEMMEAETCKGLLGILTAFGFFLLCMEWAEKSEGGEGAKGGGKIAE